MGENEVLDRLLGPGTAFATELRELLEAYPFVGIHGNAGVGKTFTANRVLKRLDAPTISIDLARCTSYGDLAYQWARELAVARLASEAVFDIETSEPRHWSSHTFDGITKFAEEFGPHIADLFQNAGRHRDSAFEPDRSLGELTRATASLGETDSAVLFIDHLEAPGLSFRHPVDVAELLWAIRSVSQTHSTLRVLVACRPAAVEIAAGQDAAFYGDGIWIRQAPPGSEDFAKATNAPPHVTDEVISYTRRHVAATLEVLQHHATSQRTFESVQYVAGCQHDVGTRALEYARSLHRLGGHLLTALAQRRGPYESSRSEQTKTVAAAMTKLSLAGLVDRDEEGGPIIADPRVEWWLTGGVADQSTSWTIAVTQRADGRYEGLRPGAPSPSLIRDTQAEAIAAAQAILRRAGGGELVIRHRNRIQESSTIDRGTPEGTT